MGYQSDRIKRNFGWWKKVISIATNGLMSSIILKSPAGAQAQACVGGG